MRGLRPPEQLYHKLLSHRLAQLERKQPHPQTNSAHNQGALVCQGCKKIEIGKPGWWLLHALIPVTEKIKRLWVGRGKTRREGEKQKAFRNRALNGNTRNSEVRETKKRSRQRQEIHAREYKNGQKTNPN